MLLSAPNVTISNVGGKADLITYSKLSNLPSNFDGWRREGEPENSPPDAGSEPRSSSDNKLATWYDYDLKSDNQKCRKDDCYSKSHATCASRDYPRETILLVKNIKNQKETKCRVNDYGPEEQTGKHLDLSSYAFKQIAPLFLGVIEVEISIYD